MSKFDIPITSAKNQVKAELAAFKKKWKKNRSLK